MAEAFREAARSTEESRKYNRERLTKRATAKQVQPGDQVVLIAHEKAPLDAKWDHEYTVTRVKGPVLHVVNQRTQKKKVVNRDKVKLVNPDLEWDDVRPRPTRTARKLPYIPCTPEPEVTPTETEEPSTNIETNTTAHHSVQKKRRYSTSETEDTPKVRRSARIATKAPVDYCMEDEPQGAAPKRKALQEDHNKAKLRHVEETRKAENRTAKDREAGQTKRQCLSATST